MMLLVQMVDMAEERAMLKEETLRNQTGPPSRNRLGCAVVIPSPYRMWSTHFQLSNGCLNIGKCHVNVSQINRSVGKWMGR